MQLDDIAQAHVILAAINSHVTALQVKLKEAEELSSARLADTLKEQMEAATDLAHAVIAERQRLLAAETEAQRVKSLAGSELAQHRMQAAMEAVRDAEATVRNSVRNMEDAARDVIKTHLAFIDNDADKAAMVMGEISSNRAGWSGGVTNPSNIIEAVRARVASEELDNVLRTTRARAARARAASAHAAV